MLTVLIRQEQKVVHKNKKIPIKSFNKIANTNLLKLAFIESLSLSVHKL